MDRWVNIRVQTSLKALFLSLTKSACVRKLISTHIYVLRGKQMSKWITHTRQNRRQSDEMWGGNINAFLPENRLYISFCQGDLLLKIYQMGSIGYEKN